MNKSKNPSVSLLITVFVALFVFSFYVKTPPTFALQSAIHQVGGEQVTYFHDNWAAGSINPVNLFEQVSIVISSDIELLLDSWTGPLGYLSFDAASDYNNNKSIAYLSEVTLPKQNHHELF